ncbi:MAG: hypothetical protein ACOC8C_01960 [Chloroflexota bacterium]
MQIQYYTYVSPMFDVYNYPAETCSAEETRPVAARPDRDVKQ